MQALTFLNYWGFAAAASLAVVGIIYVFHQRYRPRVITGLFLWKDPEQLRRGGRRPQRLRATRSFLLDLLACALLTLGLAGPAFLSQTSGEIVIVTDTSLSMCANGNSQAAAERARETIRSAEPNATFTVISAGGRPRRLAGGVPALQAMKALKELSSFAPSDSVPAAVELARELSTGNLIIHLFTDHDPAIAAPENSVLQLHLLKARFPNIALLKAQRIRSDNSGHEVLFIAVGNLWNKLARSSLSITEGGEVLFRQELYLPPAKKEYLTFEIPDETDEITIDLQSSRDTLREDSSAVLLPPPEMPLTYSVERTVPAADSIIRALSAAGAHPAPADTEPDILVTGGAEDRGGVFTVVIPSAPESCPALLGPFVTDTSHPLCWDVELEGVCWPADKHHIPRSMSHPLLSTGDIPLLYLQSKDTAVLNLAGKGGNLPRTSAWPVLFANVFRYSRQMLPGLHSVNYAPGETLAFVPPGDRKPRPAYIEGEGMKSTLEGVLSSTFVPVKPGRYRILDVDGGEIHRIRVNATAPGESDLRDLAANDRDSVSSSTADNGDMPLKPRDLSWLPFLLAVCLFGLNWGLDRLEKV